MMILASKSAARQTMLMGAGLDFKAIPATLDEREIMRAHEDKTPAEQAMILAQQKALFVAQNHKDALVVGSDQILEINGTLLNKAPDSEAAKEKLKNLRGKTHRLISAVAIARNDQILWQDTQSAFLTMHNFDDEFLEKYCTKAGDALTSNVGAYALEGPGAQLFDKIEGDYFTILGMPLLPLLKYLREEQGVSL